MPSYEDNLYSHPEALGLEVIDDIDFSSGEYEFDMTVVWKLPDGTFAYADDSGCSCPAPFEDIGLADLTHLTSLAEFKTHLEYRQSEHRPRELEIAAMLEKLHGLGVR